MQLLWVRAAVCGLVANNLGPVADIVGRGHWIVAVNVVQKSALFAGRADYDCGPLQLRGPDVATLVHQVLDQVGEQLKNGAMVTVTDRNVRLHRLPLRKVTSRGRPRSR